MRQRPLALLAVIFSLLLSAARPLQPMQPVPVTAPPPKADFIPGELIVGFQDLPDVQLFAQSQGVKSAQNATNSMRSRWPLSMCLLVRKNPIERN
jgi:hypothetical protein